MSLGVYDPADVLFVFAGIPISGYADGTFVTAERNNDSFNLNVGSNGDATRAKSNDKSGVVTFTLIQSSASNAALSAILAIDENTPSGDGIGPILIKDGQGDTLIAAETAWLRKPANVTYAREAETREWVLETDNLQMFVGGSNVAG